MLEPDSEFRTNECIKPLFQEHKLWPKMKQIVQNGVTYHLEGITEEERKEDLERMIVRGNHKSASFPNNIKSLLENYKKKLNMDGCYQSQWRA